MDILLVSRHWKAGRGWGMTAEQAPSAVAQTADAVADDTPWVRRVSGLSDAEFASHYRLPRRPVILADALAEWTACGRFTPEFFLREHGDQPVRIRGRDYRLGEVIELQQASTEEHPGPYPCTLRNCPQLFADITPRFSFSLPSRHSNPLLPKSIFSWVNHLEIFFGGPGGQFPYVHYDYLRMHAWIAQVYGDKEFTLYEPGQEHLLYVDPQRPWISVANAGAGDESYPLLSQARCHRVVVHAGEALFIPCGTWHTARCLTPGITVAFDQLGADNWREFVGEVRAAERRLGRPIKAGVLGGYLSALGPVLSLAELFGAHRGSGWGRH